MLVYLLCFTESSFIHFSSVRKQCNAILTVTLLKQSMSMNNELKHNFYDGYLQFIALDCLSCGPGTNLASKHLGRCDSQIYKLFLDMIPVLNIPVLIEP